LQPIAPVQLFPFLFLTNEKVSHQTSTGRAVPKNCVFSVRATEPPEAGDVAAIWLLKRFLSLYLTELKNFFTENQQKKLRF
jgi:hypothetical protein